MYTYILAMKIKILKAYFLLFSIYLKKKQKSKNRSVAVRRILKERRQYGAYHVLVPRMRLNDEASFRNYFRMDVQTFDSLLNLLKPHLENPATRIEETITPGERMALTLRYLANADSMKNIGFFEYRIGASTTSKIIKETCDIIWEQLKFVFPTPSTQMWRNIERNFNKWGFPNCIGAIDGKHVVVQAFPNHNSLTYNYKQSHSLVLMAVVDADYKFIFVDIGAYGHNCDASIFRNSNFGNAILNDPTKLEIPPPQELPGSSESAPFVFVGDEAFPLRPNLMRPYPGRNTGNLPAAENKFNSCLSRSRRVSENAFGIMASKFRIYRKPIFASKDTVVSIVKATTALHNWLRDNQSEYVTPELVDGEDVEGNIVPGTWQSIQLNAFRNAGRFGANNPPREAIAIREQFKNYFMTTLH